jgi:pyridoxine 5'-phosphate synthase PdxJ
MCLSDHSEPAYACLLPDTRHIACRWGPWKWMAMEGELHMLYSQVEQMGCQAFPVSIFGDATVALDKAASLLLFLLM